MVHGHVRRVGGILIDSREAAVAEVCASPGAVGHAQRRAVVLGSTNSEGGIDWMRCNARELQGVQPRVVEAGPVNSSIRRSTICSQCA